jgi:hypothetical protein
LQKKDFEEKPPLFPHPGKEKEEKRGKLKTLATFSFFPKKLGEQPRQK